MIIKYIEKIENIRKIKIKNLLDFKLLDHNLLKILINSILLDKENNNHMYQIKNKIYINLVSCLIHKFQPNLSKIHQFLKINSG